MTHEIPKAVKTCCPSRGTSRTAHCIRWSVSIGFVRAFAALVLEQTQLIRELRLLQEHIGQLENEIKVMVHQAREGKILGSMGIGPMQVETIPERGKPVA
jgi:hypothetical protein